MTDNNSDLNNKIKVTSLLEETSEIEFFLHATQLD